MNICWPMAWITATVYLIPKCQLHQLVGILVIASRLASKGRDGWEADVKFLPLESAI